jgi:hypothetical protein
MSLMTLIFGYTAAALSILMAVPYVRDILYGKTKPERASWIIWTALGGIAFFSQFAKGATDSLWLTGGQTVAVLIILLLAIPYGVGGLTKRDGIALLAAGFGLLLWYFTKEAAWALLIVIAIDSIGTMLTAMKIYADPGSETLLTWIMSGTSGIFGLLAVGHIEWILLAYPLYIAIANYTIVVASFAGRRKRQ